MSNHARTSRRSRLRHGIAAVLLLPLLLVLAGCFRLDMGLTINDDDTLDVSMEIGDITGFASRADMDCSELESDLTGDAPDGVQFSVSDIEDADGNVGCRMEATGAPLDTLADDGGMSVVRVDDTYVFSFEGDAAGLGDMSDFEDVPAGMEPQVSIAVTFPGEVISADGEIDGNTVTWRGMDAFATGGTATGEASGGALGGGSNTVVWVILGIVILLALAALIFFIAKRSKSGAGAAGAAGAPYGAAPDAAPYGSAPGSAPYGAPGAHNEPAGGFGPGSQVPADPGAGYPGQQGPGAPFSTAAADTPVHRPEGESFAPPEPAEPEPHSAPPHGAPGPAAPTEQPGEQQGQGRPHPEQPGDQPR